MYSLHRFHLFQDIIQELPHGDKAKEEMLTVCRQYYQKNSNILQSIDEFEQTYQNNDCIGWYTRDTFVYKLLNKALRTEDIEQLYKFRFYIVDLSNQLAWKDEKWEECGKWKKHDEEKITLYRGALINKNEV